MTFEEFAIVRGPSLVRLARLLTGDDHLAEDLVQEVLGRAFVRWNTIMRTGRPDLYVRRMLVNANASWWRRRAGDDRYQPSLLTGSGGGATFPVVERPRL